MKKLISITFLFIFLLTALFAQTPKTNTVITSIHIQGQIILPSAWANLEVDVKDSITFFYSAGSNKPSSAKINYKTFLDGQEIETGSDASAAFTSLYKLKEGAHVFEVFAYTKNGTESVPATIKFTVTKISSAAKDTVVGTAAAPVNNQAEFSLLTYILVGIIALLSISLIFLLFLKKNNKSAGNKSETATQEEIEDYKYSYEKLKKESKNLFDTNNFLKIQIQELKAYVKDLEDANVELVGQKEKLQDSKRQLEELQKQKDELFAIAVHDIKNPASIIKGLIELLTDYDLNAKDQQHIIQSLSETSNRIIDLAHNMAQVCARKKPEPEIMAEPGNIKEIIDSVCKRNMAYANNKGIKLINNTSFNIPKVSIDKSKMDEAIDNLVNNGIKYGPAGTIVQIKSFFNQTKITVEITDTGVGFSEEDMINVFQKGVTLSSEPTGGESRSGLGLWIVKKIIEDHGGRITLESKKGVGSKFIFELPIAKK